ncbi:PREDICTED: type-1 angiotensin II receptor-associated protein [Nanorana parkeri]|uniref:type-1 angiotensin II receptor-associated protein n=1 Tax=Nanorana parkeri TaxID=125878 RepID=UPI00085445C7|nr:PREDICTED: type-1 angiotensin II receptor-associated protein [Nanorana parkeri]
MPNAYYLANLTVLALGIWAIIQRDSIDAILMFLAGLITTVILDILLLALIYAAAEQAAEKTPGRDLFRFSGGMAILSLLLKPLSCFFTYHMYVERGGECNLFTVSSGFLSGSRDRSAYQTIDHAEGPAEQENKMPSRY